MGQLGPKLGWARSDSRPNQDPKFLVDGGTAWETRSPRNLGDGTALVRTWHHRQLLLPMVVAPVVIAASAGTAPIKQ